MKELKLTKGHKTLVFIGLLLITNLITFLIVYAWQQNAQTKQKSDLCASEMSLVKSEGRSPLDSLACVNNANN